MTKQDIELIARVLREYAPPSSPVRGVVDDLAVEFASELRATNPRFDCARFIAACVVTS